MSKTNRRRAEKRRRPARRTTRAREHTAAEPDLLADVRRALADPHPLGLLTYVSTLLCVTDSGRNHPFARPEDPDLAALIREDLVTTFLDVAAPETSALLAVIAEMAGDDDVLRARIRRELAARPKAEPAWLAQLSETSTYRAMRMHHILGDGDNFMLGARLPGGHELTCLVYIDHNLGTLVKDAFVVPASVADMVGEFGRVTEDPDTRWDDISLADARAWVDAAIELAAITFPPLETESWPACRALVEWITRGLPEGGTGYQRPQWDSAALARLTDQFFCSTYGAGLDDSDHRGLLESLLWYSTDYGPGDPLRWSPVKVEILLDDWIPRKIVAPAEYLAKAPDLLRAFIHFAHEEVGLRSDLTDEALEVLALSDRCCEEMLDLEYRTACRRVLARVVSKEPEVFRRTGRAETAAAALVWIVGKANDLFEQRTGGMHVRDLMSHFGLRQSSVAQRAATMLRAGGFNDDTYIVRLGSPDYLVAARRRRIIKMRDKYRELPEQMS